MRQALAYALLLTALFAHAGSRPFTAGDLVMLDRVSDPQLSTDGRYVAYSLRETDLEANRGISGIWLMDLAAKQPEPRRLTARGQTSVSPRWSSDDTLYFLSTRSGSQQVWRLDLEGGEAMQVTDLPVDVAAFAVAPGGRRLAMAMDVYPDCKTLGCTQARTRERAGSKATGRIYDRLFVRHWDTWKDGTRARVFVADLDGTGKVSGEPRMVSQGVDGDVPSKPFGGDEDFTFTPDGKAVILAARLSGSEEPWSTNFDLWRVSADGAQAPQNLTGENPAADTGPALSPDGRYLAWRAMQRAGFESDRYRIMLRDLKSGQTRELAADWDRSARTLQWSPDSRRIYVTADEGGQTPLFAIGLRDGKAQRLTGEGSVAGYTISEDRIVYALDTLASPARLYGMDPDGKKSRALTHHNQGRLSDVAFGDFEQFRFAGWNEEIVHGYVMKPFGFESGKKYPVAFLIHGGPQGSFGNHWHYRWNPQTYAGAGYAVVFIDFHGSTGYGQAFTDSISQDWGGKPLEDLKKGWAYALKTYNFLDGDRACALGASYGGWMVNWIAGNWPDGFKCLVNHDGILDNRAMYYETEELWFVEWEHGGPQFVVPQSFEKHNPVNHVSKWKTPMLVIHGGLDYRIPDSQGIATFTALQRRGIESRFLYFPDENHWVLKPHNSIQWHDTVEGWLRRWLM